jgi:hypothetical protein
VPNSRSKTLNRSDGRNGRDDGQGQRPHEGFPMTDDLATWLLACIAEDEHIAKDAAGGYDGAAARWQVSDGNVHLVGEYANAAVAVGPFNASVGVAAAHIARHDPARVLAECEAKRALVEMATEEPPADILDDLTLGAQESHADWSRFVLRQLAGVYADRPGYREEWKP